MRQYFLFLNLLALLLVCATSANAELYKWVDDEGNIHYSDEQPSTTKQTVTVIDESAAESLAPATDRPITRPYDKQVTKLHLLDTQYLWKQPSHKGKSIKLGIFSTGTGCTSVGAIKSHEVISRHSSFFPEE